MSSIDNPATASREAVCFRSGPTECAAWHYPSANRACVVMAGGFGVTKEPATDRFAARFHGAGFGVLAFDYRHLGESGGEPRQVVRIPEQLDDWHAAVAHARTLPGVDDARIAIWGFSISGGQVLEVAARDRHIAAAVAQTPNADGRAATRNALRHQRPSTMARLMGRGMLDAIGGAFGRPPRLVPLAGPRGTVALLTTPDAVDGGSVLDPSGRYPTWCQAVAARSVLRVGSYRPGRAARDIVAPLLVVVADDDQSALAAPAVRAAERAPRGEIVHVRGGHYAPFLDAHDEVIEAELAFLRRHLLDES